jgi:hypothetical protein
MLSLGCRFLTAERFQRRAEVLAAHVPADDDEWLVYETSKLIEFTRLFPPLKGGKSFFLDEGTVGAGTSIAAVEGDTDGQDAEGGDEEDEGGIKALQTKSSSGSSKPRRTTRLSAR